MLMSLEQACALLPYSSPAPNLSPQQPISLMSVPPGLQIATEAAIPSSLFCFSLMSAPSTRCLIHTWLKAAHFNGLGTISKLKNNLALPKCKHLPRSH